MFTSRVGVTTTHGVSHHLLVAAKRRHKVFLATPINEIENITCSVQLVSRCQDVIACKSTGACLSALEEQPSSKINSSNTLTAAKLVPPDVVQLVQRTTRITGCVAPSLVDVGVSRHTNVRTYAWRLPQTRFKTSRVRLDDLVICPPCRKMRETGACRGQRVH